MTEKKYVEVDIDLDLTTIALLEAEAKRRKITVDEVIEEALSMFLAEDHRKTRFGEDTH